MVAIKLKVLLRNVICTCTSIEVNVYEMHKANVHEVNISPLPHTAPIKVDYSSAAKRKFDQTEEISNLALGNW